MSAVHTDPPLGSYEPSCVGQDSSAINLAFLETSVGTSLALSPVAVAILNFEFQTIAETSPTSLYFLELELCLGCCHIVLSRLRTSQWTLFSTETQRRSAKKSHPDVSR